MVYKGLKISKFNLKISVFITGGLFLVSGFLWLTPKALTYSDTTTHPDLTREIIIFYELSTGKKFTEEQKQWTISGSIEEDKSPRWLNHFYDPVFERGLQAESIGISGYLAKNWAQFSSYQTVSPLNIGNLWSGRGPVISGSWWGDFSYEAAIKDYSRNKEKESYIALGHTLHLIEDMTVPEHTRNDPHPGGDKPSYYENWTREKSSGLTQDLGQIIYNQGRKPIIYSDLESYFNNLATYTNTHFFSPRTINSKIYQKPKIIFEDGTFAYGKDENGEFFDLAIIINNKGNKNYALDDKHNQILQEYWLRLSRHAVVNGAGVIQLFLTEAEKAREKEVAKQKLESQQLAKKSSFISQILNFFKSPEAPISEPVLTITSELTPVAPKIVKQETAANSVVVQKPAPTQPKLAPSVVAPSLAPVPTLTPAPAPTPAPQNTAPGFSGGGGGGGGSGSSSALSQQANQSTNEQETQQTNSNATSTDNNLNILTFSAGDLVINEIMYDLGGDLGNIDTNREWIEIFNPGNKEINLEGGKLFDGDGETNSGLNTPPKNGGQGSMVIAAGGYAILVAKADVFLADHSGFSGTVIDTVLDLKNSEDTIRLLAPDGTILDEITYSSSWGADGNGKTLERKLASGGSSDATNWAQSSAPGGTPGAANNFEITMATLLPSVATSTSPIATSTEPILTNLGTDVAATTTITTNTTWTLAGSPYRLFFDNQRRPTVAAGAVLTIEPGVKIIPQNGGATALEIQGTLNAIATSGAPIIFTSMSDADNNASTTPQKGDWLNIAFSQGSQANLDYVEFRYGGQGITLPLHEMVNVTGATINIKNSKFENSQNTALHLLDSSGKIENSVFSDNNCGISIDSSNGIAYTSYGGCYGLHTTGQVMSSTTLQINNNQFTRNQNIGIEVRSGTAPTINNNIFTDNGYPVKIESSYPNISNSQIVNSTTSTNFLNGIAISGYTHFSHDFSLKKDLPYILEANGSALSPYVDLGAILILDPGVIFKIGHNFTALNINGSLIASTTPDNPIIFTSLKDDLQGGDTNNDGPITSPQNNDWASIKFLTGSIGNFYNTLFNFGGFGSPPAATTTSSQLITDFPLVSNVSNQSCDAVTSKINLNNNENFSKVIIHKLTNNNPTDNARFQLGESTTEFGNYTTHEEVIVNNPSYNNSEIELNFNSAINTGLWYMIRFLGITDGSVATSCDWGTDETGNLASAWYKLVTTVSNPAISIDPGATVVIQ